MHIREQKGVFDIREHMNLEFCLFPPIKRDWVGMECSLTWQPSKLTIKLYSLLALIKRDCVGIESPFTWQSSELRRWRLYSPCVNKNSLSLRSILNRQLTPPPSVVHGKCIQLKYQKNNNITCKLQFGRAKTSSSSSPLTSQAHLQNKRRMDRCSHSVLFIVSHE